MAGRLTHLQFCRTLTLLGLFLCSGICGPIVCAEQNPFSEHEATQLLRQISAGLVSHNPRRMLSAFDLDHMNDGRTFTKETLSFFAQTAAIRVHFNLLRTTVEGSTGVAEANIEMEADRVDDRLPPLYKQTQVRLICEKTSGGWKITDLVPREFFTIQP